jgi:hypothetical protein
VHDDVRLNQTGNFSQPLTGVFSAFLRFDHLLPCGARNEIDFAPEQNALYQKKVSERQLFANLHAYYIFCCEIAHQTGVLIGRLRFS